MLARTPLNQAMPTWPNSMPNAPPATARTNVSASNCETIRQRLEPRAVRMATSFDRATVRASRRFATFTQAISRTPNTAPSIVYSMVMAAVPMNVSVIVRTTTRIPSFVSGYSASSRPAIVAISVWASSSVTPSFRRAMA